MLPGNPLITPGGAASKKKLLSSQPRPTSQMPMIELGFDANHSLPLLGLMALKPPSPPSEFCHAESTKARPVLGDPLSCAPPNITFGSVGCTEKETNSVIEPRV